MLTQPSLRLLAVALFTLGMLFQGISSTFADATAEPLAAAGVTRDGLRPETAAASCWEVAQVDPEAPSGVYWLSTPTLRAPEQFYCDQEHDGGGWVLVGKGREGWEEYYGGQGEAGELLARPAQVTPDYFATVQLPAATVDGLLDGTDVSALPDGIRINRALDPAGTRWQQVQLRERDRDRWVWTMSAPHRLTAYRFDTGTWRSGGTVNNVGQDNAALRLTNAFDSGNGYRAGFGYGTRMTGGSTSATTFLWSKRADGSSPRPYAEVYLRPRLLSDDLTWPAIPDEGTAAQAQRPVADSYAARGTWGVTGNLNGRTAEGNAQVQSFAEGDGVVYVAGNFSTVQQGSQGAPVSQAGLAAFDADTGDFVPGFAPTFNNQVKAVVVLPDGSVLAGGDFTVANGRPALGTVLLDPVTGATLPRWDLTIENRLSSGVLTVRDLAVLGDHVYLGGGFTHLRGGGGGPVYAKHAARVEWATGRPDPGWNPEFNGTVMSVDTGHDRLYAAGYFTRSVEAAAEKAAAIRAVAGAPLVQGWNPTWSATTRANYQQAIRAVGDQVYVGGSEHSLFGFSATTFQRLSGTITHDLGGDFQAIDTDATASVVYAGCHCSRWSFDEAYTWPSIGTGWTQADRIAWIGAWDAQTGARLPQFDPPALGSRNAGAWAIFVASDGTTWVGGDFTRSQWSPTRSQWAGSFVRFPLNDHTAPTAPSELTLTGRDEDSATWSWTGSQDDREVTGYELLRDDRVVAVVPGSQHSVTVPLGGQDRYAVRARDAAGNRSASTPVAVLADQPVPPTVTTPIPAGSTWSYRYELEAPGQDWAGTTFDDSAWASGTAPLGWGSSFIATPIAPTDPAQRARTVYARHDVDIVDPGSVQRLTLSLVADDGAVVHVNDTEVGRLRMAEGPVTHDTYAHQAISTNAARSAPLQVDVPLELLVAGTNTVAVETHLNYRSTPNVSLELTAELVTAP